jgi:hypothetical protein
MLRGTLSGDMRVVPKSGFRRTDHPADRNGPSSPAAFDAIGAETGRVIEIPPI